VKIIATADLHYEWREDARALVRQLAREVCAEGADLLAIAGDTFAFRAAILDEALALFDDFRGAKVLVAGNHDLWTEDGDSLVILNDVIPRIARAHGFVPLCQEPLVLGSLGVVGTIGWYDYSFRPQHLDVPLRFYEHKTAPGYAAATEPWRFLLEPPNDPVPPELLRIGAQWQDVRYVRLGMSDVEFTRDRVERLRTHLAQVRDRVETIVAVLHHLPFREAVIVKPAPGWQFASAFQGAQVFGDLLAAEPKVRLALYGHTHAAGIVTRGPVLGVNCGSTYRRKQYVVVDTDSWAVHYRTPAERDG
jgi:predicted phosphohydrolase